MTSAPDEAKTAAGADDCPLTPSEQRRNMLVFAGTKSLIYLAAPVLYVGVVQSAIVRDYLGGREDVANLPASFYFAMTPAPVLIAWLLPKVAWLKRLLAWCFLLAAVTLGVVAATLLLDVPNTWKIVAVVLQGLVCGVALMSADALIWELAGRGTSDSRRALMLSLAFGVGPILAAVASMGTQILLARELFDVSFDHLLPAMTGTTRGATLYALAAPMMAVASWLCLLAVVPSPGAATQREPISEMLGGARRFLGDRVLLTATVVIVLLYAGNAIPSNMNLYTPQAVGGAATEYAGYQNFLRFIFKAAAGFAFGWLLRRTNPKLLLLLTGAVFAAAPLWAANVTGPWYLAAFFIFGAGELVGVYAPNYIVAASPKADLRRNTAFVTLMLAPVALQGYLFGLIARYGNILTSFYVCIGLMAVGLVVGWFLLPARPKPVERGVVGAETFAPS